MCRFFSGAHAAGTSSIEGVARYRLLAPTDVDDAEPAIGSVWFDHPDEDGQRHMESLTRRSPLTIRTESRLGVQAG